MQKEIKCCRVLLGSQPHWLAAVEFLSACLQQNNSRVLLCPLSGLFYYCCNRKFSKFLNIRNKSNATCLLLPPWRERERASFINKPQKIHLGFGGEREWESWNPWNPPSLNPPLLLFFFVFECTLGSLAHDGGRILPEAVTATSAFFCVSSSFPELAVCVSFLHGLQFELCCTVSEHETPAGLVVLVFIVVVVFSSGEKLCAQSHSVPAADED